MNCDEQKETCNCTQLMEEDVCTAANLTAGIHIERFITSNSLKNIFSWNIDPSMKQEIDTPCQCSWLY